MRVTGKEILEYCEELLHLRGENVQTMCDSVGISPARLFMWKSKDVSPRLDILLIIIKYLGITLDELIGITENKEIPDSVKYCENMLLHINEESREIITKIIQIYFEKNKSEL